VLPLAAAEASASAGGEEYEVAAPAFVWVPSMVAARASAPKPPDSPWVVRSWSFDAMMAVLLLGFAQRESAMAHLTAARAVAGPQPSVGAASPQATTPSDWAGVYDALKRPPLPPAARSSLVAASWSLRRASGVFSYAATVVCPLLTDSLAPRTRRGWTTVKVPPDVVPAPQRAIADLCMAETAVCICLVAEAGGKTGDKTAQLWSGAAAKYTTSMATLCAIVSPDPGGLPRARRGAAQRKSLCSRVCVCVGLGAAGRG
jgi:hypothetical protein